MAEAQEAGPLRRCIVTRAVLPKADLVRFVIGPDSTVVPDLTETLPGRGLWVRAERAAVREAVRKRAFQRAAKGPARAAEELPDQVEHLLARHCIELVSLARRAGQAVAGFAKVEGWARSGVVAVVIEAADGAADGRRKLRALAPGAAMVTALTSRELGLAFGRENVVHAALRTGNLATRFLGQTARLSGFRNAGAAAAPGASTGDQRPGSIGEDRRIKPDAAADGDIAEYGEQKGTG